MTTTRAKPTWIIRITNVLTTKFIFKIIYINRIINRTYLVLQMSPLTICPSTRCSTRITFIIYFISLKFCPSTTWHWQSPIVVHVPCNLYMFVDYMTVLVVHLHYVSTLSSWSGCSCDSIFASLSSSITCFTTFTPFTPITLT